MSTKSNLLAAETVMKNKDGNTVDICGEMNIFRPFFDINSRAKHKEILLKYFLCGSVSFVLLWRLSAQYEPFFNSDHADLHGWPKETMMYCVWGEEILS